MNKNIASEKRSWAASCMGSSIKDVRKKGGGDEAECGRKWTRGEGGFQRTRTSAYLSHVDLEDRVVCVSACKPEP